MQNTVCSVCSHLGFGSRLRPNRSSFHIPNSAGRSLHYFYLSSKSLSHSYCIYFTLIMLPNGYYPALCRPLLSRPSAFISRRSTPQARSFHSSKPCQMIEGSVILAHDYLQGFHSLTGLPWVASIPLAAITVRLVIATPLQIWSLRQREASQQVNRFLVAWNKVYQKKAVTSDQQSGSVKMGPVQAELIVTRELNETKRRLHKTWGVYPGASYAQVLLLPVWLSVMESLRRMVGMSSGLLGMIQSWYESMPVDGGASIPVEPSMATQGALWFPDLLAADSTCALPVILSAMMFTNITWGWKLASAAEIAEMSVGQAIKNRLLKVLKRTLQVLSIWLAPTMIFSEAPAGLLIYWISSVVFATAQTKVLHKIVPTRQSVAPAKGRQVGSVHDQDDS